MILNIGGGGGVKPRIVVTAPTGSDVTVSKGTTILYAPEVSGTWTFNVPEQGDWSATAILGSKTASKVVSVGKVGVYNVTLRYVSATLNDNSWEDIKGVADDSAGQNYWAVGDTKQITINGKLSDGLTLSNYSTYVYIIGFDHNKDVEGTGIAFGGFKTAQASGTDVALCDSGYGSVKSSGQWFNMNNSSTNAGGWKSSLMRSTTLPVVKSALPSELTSVIKTTTIYSDNTGGGSDVASYVTATLDELYLLAEFEIFGERKYANTAEQNYQQQYAYYVAGNSKIKYNHGSTSTAVRWWERSLYVQESARFCAVVAYGDDSAYSPLVSYGLAPAFKVGTTPIFPTLNDNSWSAIAKVAYTSEGANYWSVGDTKEVVLNGAGVPNVDFVYYNTYVYILGFDHNEDIEGKGIIFGGFKTAQTGGVDVALCDSGYGIAHSAGQWFNINNTNSNAGGWASSRMRSNVLQDIKNSLPSDLTSVIKTSTIYTDNTGGGSDVSSYVTATQDDLYLLAEYEIFGAHDYANSAEQNYQQQYEYYSSGGRRKKIKYRYNSTSSAAYWWERSLRATTNYEWTYISTDGYQVGGNCDMSFGLAPAFRVCYTPPRPISNFAVGDIVKVKESGADVDYIIVHHGNPDTTIYDASLDGTWLLRKDSVTRNYLWSTFGEYSGSVVDNYLKNTFVGTLNISNIIKTVKIPYVSSVRITTENPYTISSGANGLSEQAFLLSCVEIGGVVGDNYGAPEDGVKLDYFNLGNASDDKRIAYYGSTIREWWTRSPSNYQNYYAWRVNTTGSIFYSNGNEDNYGVRPAFIIPSDTLVDSSGNIVID